MCPQIFTPFAPPSGYQKTTSVGGGILAHRAAAVGPISAQDAFDRCISTLNATYREVVSYQPASRFWTFQTIETALFVALALALAGLCAWWVRHRVS